jgi:hypothetical protein
MVIADVYYNHTLQKYLREGGYGCDKYAWGVNFMKMVADVYGNDDGGKRQLLLANGDRVVMKAANLQWAKNITSSLRISFIDKDGTTYYHAIELMVTLSVDKAASHFRTFINAVTMYADDIPLADDMNIDNIFADGIERVVADRLTRANETIADLERTIAEMNATAVQASRRFSETISTIVSENATTMARVDANIRRLRDENVTLEKRIITATKIYRDKTRLSGWYVYEIASVNVSIDLKLRGGHLIIDDMEHISGDDVYYVTNDADPRYEDDYVTMNATAGIDHLHVEDRLTFVTVPIRRNTFVQGVIVRISDTSFIMTHLPKTMMKSTIEQN